ncbi:glycosyltransferase family 2 protein [Crateriforma conspicua]|uniref:glycosyltransferase family 2 protein n=1 Tax=Crateriforma conspicua TaxID=2527996 RepID=UPI00118B234F|nr:Undecaprenyl-phosphate 4-deoxy-4-formamido-L-arabinose transferase [Crateriforma conspicua]
MSVKSDQFEGPAVSVIVPVFNEEQTVILLLDRLERCLRDLQGGAEIIVVDDGSDDSTGASIRDWLSFDRSLSIKSFRLDRNRGKASAVNVGFRHASGEWILIQDADLEYDPRDIKHLMGRASSNTSAVYGLRPSCAELPNRWVPALGVLAVDVAIFLLYGRFVRDHATCYKLVRSSVFRTLELSDAGFEGCVEMTCKLIRMNIRIHQVRICYVPRSKSDGKKLRWSHGFAALLETVRWIGWKPKVFPSAKGRPETP